MTISPETRRALLNQSITAQGHASRITTRLLGRGGTNGQAVHAAEELIVLGKVLKAAFQKEVKKHGEDAEVELVPTAAEIKAAELKKLQATEE